MNTDQATFIVRVLTHQGPDSIADDDILPHLREIGARYDQLKRTSTFMDAIRTARAEWLLKITSAPPADAQQPNPPTP